MTRKMYDSVNAAAIPTDAQMVAGYVHPSGYAWSDAAWARFPNAVHVKITPQVSTTGLGIHVLDVETGDATPAQAPGWVRAQRALGQDPTVYCSEGLWTTVQNAFNAAGVAQPHYWVAAYPGAGASIPNGAIAHQYAGSTSSGGNYDLSVVADFWPGVDTQGQAVDDMALTDSLAAYGGVRASDGAPVTTGDALATAYVALSNASHDPEGKTLFDRFTALDNALAALAAAKPTAVTLSPDQLTAIEATVSTAVAGLNLSVSPTDQAAIAKAVAAELGAKLSA